MNITAVIVIAIVTFLIGKRFPYEHTTYKIGQDHTKKFILMYYQNRVRWKCEKIYIDRAAGPFGTPMRIAVFSNNSENIQLSCHNESIAVGDKVKLHPRDKSEEIYSCYLNPIDAFMKPILAPSKSATL